MRASTAVNFDFDTEVDESVARGAAADLGEDSLEVGDASVLELDRTEAGAADVADAAVPELDRTGAGAADVTDCPAVTP